ncbi:hypothetical protein AAK938_09135 [Aerococcaceae bacterium 50-4]
MKRQLTMLVLTSFLLGACGSGTNEPNEVKNSSTSSVSEQAISSDASAENSRLETITVEEIEEKKTNGDSLFVFIPDESEADNARLENTITAAYDLIGDKLEIGYPMGDGHAYTLNVADDSDQLTVFRESYGIEDRPSFIYFEGDISMTKMDDFEASVTAEEIATFIDFPYDEADATAAPDIKIEDNET